MTLAEAVGLAVAVCALAYLSYALLRGDRL